MATFERPGQLLFVGFEGRDVPPLLARRIGEGRIGGVILFARNVDGPEGVARLVETLHAAAPKDSPLTVAIDQEGGRVQRLRAPFTEWPAMRVLASAGRPDLTRGVADAIGRELADLRIDLNFAPVADVDTNPANPVIGDRSFSRDPEVVAAHAAAFVQGQQRQGVAACAKHFPGHGDTSVDSHVSLPRVSHDLDRLRRVEFPPFRAAIEAGVASLMSAHVVVDCLDPSAPATLCRRVMDVLRGELGWNGLVFSDDMEMAAAGASDSPGGPVRAALDAGVDALLVCRREDLWTQALAELERAPDALLERSLRRMAHFKSRYAGGYHASGSRPPYPAHIALAASLSDAASAPSV